MVKIMATIRISRRKGTYRIYKGDIILHNERSFEFIKGWLENQIKGFKNMVIEI